MREVFSEQALASLNDYPPLSIKSPAGILVPFEDLDFSRNAHEHSAYSCWCQLWKKSSKGMDECASVCFKFIRDDSKSAIGWLCLVLVLSVPVPCIAYFHLTSTHSFFGLTTTERQAGHTSHLHFAVFTRGPARTAVPRCHWPAGNWKTGCSCEWRWIFASIFWWMDVFCIFFFFSFIHFSFPFPLLLYFFPPCIYIYACVHNYIFSVCWMYFFHYRNAPLHPHLWARTLLIATCLYAVGAGRIAWWGHAPHLLTGTPQLLWCFCVIEKLSLLPHSSLIFVSVFLLIRISSLQCILSCAHLSFFEAFSL